MTMALCVCLYATSSVSGGVPCVPSTSPRLGFAPLALSRRSTVCSDRRKLSCCNQNPGGTLAALAAVSGPASLGGGGFPFSTPAKTRGPDSLPAGRKGQEGSPLHHAHRSRSRGEGYQVHEPELCLSLWDFLPLPSEFSPFFGPFWKVISVQCGPVVV